MPVGRTLVINNRHILVIVLGRRHILLKLCSSGVQLLHAVLNQGIVMINNLIETITKP